MRGPKAPPPPPPGSALSRACAEQGAVPARAGQPRPEPEALGVLPEAGSRRRGGRRGERPRERPPGMSQPPPPEPPPPPPAPPPAPAPPRRGGEEEEEEEEEEGPGGGGAPPEPRPKGAVYRLGSTQCRRCLITFPDAAFAARHAKRQHPRDFAAAALRGALFVCFVCARPFASSPALLRHQRAHAPAAPPDARPPPPAPAAAAAAAPAYACTECGRAFAREGALHRHYIRHARGEL
ncbi:uncharacterized protein LOC142403415 [Mycteria americana]|uniref:uncharacterized protein LOC142403415 n=1 Tax=Mycteria americana TaxID=33587 RepID=UPI003F58E11D